MSSIGSNAEDLVLNADGSSSEIKLKIDGTEKASISSAGAFTSTTIDATALTGALPAISGASLIGLTSSQMPTGSVLQVVEGSSSTQTSTTGTSYTDSGLSTSITPSSTSSKILILGAVNCATITDNHCKMQLVRDTTSIRTWNIVTASQFSGHMPTMSPLNMLDTPNTTSSLTYKFQYKSRDSGETVYNQYGNSKSTITLMEIAG